MLLVIRFVVTFCVLLLALSWILRKRNLALTFPLLAGIFCFKVALGCAYGYLYGRFYHGDDTWAFFQDSIPETDKLLHHQGAFLGDFLPFSVFLQAPSFWLGLRNWLNDLEYWSLVKMLAVFNLFSGKNYYIDTVCFNGVTLIGPLLLYSMLRKHFAARRQALIACIFFIPSVTFWLSGIRSEGLLLVSMALAIFATDRWFSQKKWWYILFVVLGFTGMAIYRREFLFLMLPPFVAWTLASQNRQKAFSYFIIIYITCLGIFLLSVQVNPSRNLATPLITRQLEFFRLHGNTRYQLDSLKPQIGRIAALMPQGAVNAILRPFPWEANGVLQWLSAMESLAMTGVFILFLFHFGNGQTGLRNQPLLLFFILYSMTALVMIGMVVPFPGAIVRYRSIPELFLLTGIILAVRVQFFTLKRKII